MNESDYWRERYYKAADAFSELKAITKKIHAGAWTPEYRELAGRIHTLGRDVFYVETNGDLWKNTVADGKNVEVECPKCGHKFWHSIGDAIKDVASAVVNTIAKSTDLGGDS